MWSDFSSFFYWFAIQKSSIFYFCIMESYTKTYEKPQVFIGFSTFSDMGKRTILNLHPSKNVSIFHSNSDQKINQKSSKNRHFLGSRIWTNFGTNFAPFWEGFGRDLAPIGSHFERLGPSWTASWVPLAASWRVLGRLWTTKSQF